MVLLACFEWCLMFGDRLVACCICCMYFEVLHQWLTVLLASESALFGAWLVVCVIWHMEFEVLYQ